MAKSGFWLHHLYESKIGRDLIIASMNMQQFQCNYEHLEDCESIYYHNWLSHMRLPDKCNLPSINEKTASAFIKISDGYSGSKSVNPALEAGSKECEFCEWWWKYVCMLRCVQIKQRHRDEAMHLFKRLRAAWCHKGSQASSWMTGSRWHVPYLLAKRD